MAKYILLECNRLRGTNILSEDEDIHKNKWTNLVSSTGIVINKGDQIEIDQTIVNSRGASDQVMEFQGIKNENGFLDNKARLEYSFYINHNGSQTARMPFINTRTFRGNVDILGIDITNNPPASGGTPKSNNGANPPYGDLTRLLSCRSLGENLFFGQGSGGGGLNIYNNTLTSGCVELYYCSGKMLFRAKTTTTGSGGAGDVNGGYTVGQVYNTTLVSSPLGGSGSGMRIRIEQVTTSSNIYGIVQNWSVQEMGEGYLNGDVVELTITGTPAPISHRLTVSAFPDISTFTSSNNKSFDGSRYFFANHDYTGLAFKDEASGVTETPSNDFSNLVSTISKRTAQIDLEVDKGFLTPDNVGQILTDQIHKPNKISSSNNTAPFIDYDKIKYFKEEPNGSISSDFGRPVLIDTPTFKQSIANFYGSGIKGNSVNTNGTILDTLTNCRRQFYNSLAWKDGDRYFALKNCFYNFGFTISDENPSTDIKTGNEGTEYTVTTIGDFANLSLVKNMGVRTCLLNRFTAHPSDPNLVQYKKNGVIVSNMKFNKSNVERLAKHFKKAEVFTGDLSQTIDTTSSDYHDKLAVNLDIGLYDDELSTQGNLTKNGGIDAPNQKRRYATYIETTRTNCIVATDQSTCRGYKRDFNNRINNGQELSSIYVYSRWKEGFAYQNRNAYTDGVAVDTDTDNFIIQNDGIDGFDTTFGGVLSNIDKFFLGQFTNPVTGQVETYLDYQQMARDNDLAIIPVFPRNYGNNKFGKDSGDPNDVEPYIGFISRYKIGIQTGWDTTNLDNPNNTWVIDIYNALVGSQLGLDPSFTRNEAVCVINPQVGNINPDLKENYMNMVNIGANDPTFSFNPQLSRFEISGLNTPTTIGNGLQSSVPETIQANPNPDQQIINVNRGEQVMRRQDKIQLDPASATLIGDANVVDMFNLAIQEEGTILDSQSGIAFESYSLFDENGNVTEITDKDKYRESLFDKMGFDLIQLIGDYGNENATFINQFTFQQLPQTYETGNQFNIKPVTTGSYVSSSEVQTLSVNEEAMPMYDLGIDTGCRQVEPSITNGSISAFKLPVKLSFPYLCIYSSIPSGGVDTQYIGGSDGESKIPCMGFLTRENNEGDFFYQGGTTFNFTALKDFTLSEVETDIRLPDGSRPKLDPNSAVIYKITKPLQNIQPPPTKK